MKKQLIVIGSGIKSIAHLSVEAVAHIKQSEKLFYLVNEPILQEWLLKNNQTAEPLDKNIEDGFLRSNYYEDISKYILENFQKYSQICVVIYGHPTVYAMPALNAAREAKRRGFATKILPAISAEDCLFADLLIDPASSGCQSYEATDFLIHCRSVDTCSHLILWQVGFIGALGNINYHDNRPGIKILIKYLLQFYKKNHEVIVYEAAMYPHLEHRATKCCLDELDAIFLSSLSTLYIPPLNFAGLNIAMLEALNINREFLVDTMK